MANVAFLLGEDFEDSEFRVPYDFLRKAGHQVVVLGAKKGVYLQGKGKKENVLVEDAVEYRSVNEFAALVIPGGYSPDHLRMDSDVVAFVHGFMALEKLVAAVCHGPQLLIEAKQVKGRRLTSWPSVKTDLENAGAEWLDQEVVIDGGLITSRRPGDLNAFSLAILRALEPGSPSHLDEEMLAAQRQSERTLRQ